MPTCREANNTDLCRIDTPRFSIGTDRANGALSVEQRHKRPSLGQSVFQYHSSNAVVVQPFCDPVPLGTGYQSAISTARADHNGAAVGLCCLVDSDPCFGFLERFVTDWRIHVP